MATRRDGNRGVTVIVRKEEVVAGAHHGGAWKVAYADFVTAMMAFFLLMWLLNATTEEQRRGLADYFSPSATIVHAHSGNGQIFGGHTPFDDGAMASDRGAVQVMQGPLPVPPDPDEDPAAETPAQPRTYQRRPDPPGPPADSPPPGSAAREAAAGAAGSGAAALGTQGPGDSAAGPQGARDHAVHAPADGAAQGPPGGGPDAAGQEQAGQEQARLERAAEQVRAAVRADPALADLARQLAVDVTPQGLRIQVLDEDRRPMFATGSSAPNDRARQLLLKVVPVLARLTEDIAIAGYTDAAPYPGPERTNWELSAERANATRRLLTEAGLPTARIASVTGHADRDPLLPATPLAAANRRIAIVVLRRELPPAPETPPSPAGR